MLHTTIIKCAAKNKSFGSPWFVRFVLMPSPVAPVELLSGEFWTANSKVQFPCVNDPVAILTITLYGMLYLGIERGWHA